MSIIMFMRRLSSCPLRVDLKLSPPCHRARIKAGAALTIPALYTPSSSLESGFFRACGRSRSYNAWADCPMGDARRPPAVSIPSVEAAGRAEIFRALEASLGHEFSSRTLTPSRRPLILIISGPSGAGKDAVITRLSEVREGLHFVVTATSRPKRPCEVDGKDYHFMTKDQFISMVENDELLEYALVYGDYKGVPKQQIRDYLVKGFDIVLRVDIQGAETLRSIFQNSAVFIFIVAESEAELVERLIGRKTETAESLLIRAETAREELTHVRKFDYVVTNTRGKLDEAVKRVESIIDAERAKVNQGDPLLLL